MWTESHLETRNRDQKSIVCTGFKFMGVFTLPK